MDTQGLSSSCTLYGILWCLGSRQERNTSLSNDEIDTFGSFYMLFVYFIYDTTNTNNTNSWVAGLEHQVHQMVV